jgi:phosphohistidine phosphatase
VSRRHLLLLRHAKSSWDDGGLPDHDRPLAPRGEKALARLRAHLDASGTEPDLVICSSARRTVQTLDGIRGALAAGATVSVEGGIYLADAQRLLERVHQIGHGVRCALLVGHNPGLEDLAALLVGSGDADLRAALAAKYPTGALAHVSFDGGWSDLGPGAGRLEDYFVPRPPRTGV